MLCQCPCITFKCCFLVLQHRLVFTLYAVFCNKILYPRSSMYAEYNCLLVVTALLINASLSFYCMDNYTLGIL